MSVIIEQAPSIVRASVCKLSGGSFRQEEDTLAIEEPLEIRIGDRSLSITMRTPGDDFDLAAGFLFAENIVSRPDQIVSIRMSADQNPNIVIVELSPDAVLKTSQPERSFVITSACGVCGKESLDALLANRCPPVPYGALRIAPAVINRLPAEILRHQAVFESTGGLHAAALFNAAGELQFLHEDVGRHNAVDKLIGHALMTGLTPLSESLMLVSGRASFELVQKALVAGIPILAAVGAPSSLAVSTAQTAGLTLIGFLRNERFNIYTGTQRVGPIA